MTNLKQLINEVERLNNLIVTHYNTEVRMASNNKLSGIKQTVEAVDVVIMYADYYNDYKYKKDWQKLKKLLGIK